MKNRLFVIIFIMTLLLAGCATQGGSGAAENSGAASAGKAAKAVLKGRPEVFAPSSDIIGYLEDDKFEEEMAAAKEAEKTKKSTNLLDYLVKVEITEENFSEYFEFAEKDKLNEIGEYEASAIGLVNKKYKEGMLIYDFGEITIGYSVTGGTAATNKLADMFSFNHIYPTAERLSGEDVTLTWLMPGTVTFLKDGYVRSIRTEESMPKGWSSETIELMNGVTFKRFIADEYPY